MDQINVFLDTFGLAAIFLILLAKSIGLPIPIPADAIMLATAARTAEGKLVLWQAFIVTLLALVIGSTVQFAVVRGPGRRLLYRFGRYLGMPPARLDAAAAKVQKGGPVGIGVAILTPGVRSVTVTACGLADLPLKIFIAGMTLGSAMFLSLHFFIGFVGRSLLMSLNISLPAAIAIVVALAVIGFGVWMVIRRRKNPGAPNADIAAEAFHAWHEATCPVCLALGAASRFEQPEVVEVTGDLR